MPMTRARGRPSKGEQAKRAPLNMKTDPVLRHQIEEAAAARGVSLTQEVEARLRTSFLLEQPLGRHIHNLMLTIGIAIDRIEMEAGEKWTEDYDTFLAVSEAVRRLLTLRAIEGQQQRISRLAEEHARVKAEQSDAADAS